MSNKFVSGIIGAFIVIVITVCIYELAIADKTGPVISYGDGEITYTEGEDESILLKDVKAEDSRDGDVSKSLIISKKVVLNDGNKIKIVYAAVDSHKNITEEDRVVNYVSNGSTAKPNTDKDNDDNKATNESDSAQSETTIQSETTTAVSTGPTGEIDRAAADISGVPVIKLNAVEATVTVGQAFDEISMVRETYDNSGDVSRRIRIDGTYDIGVAGDYHFNYMVSDKEGNVSEPAPFTLHVVPAQNNPDTSANAQAANNGETTAAPTETTTARPAA